MTPFWTIVIGLLLVWFIASGRAAAMLAAIKS
jgi:hypothetical protein